MCASMQTDLHFCSLLFVGIVSELVLELFQFSAYYALKLRRLDVVVTRMTLYLLMRPISA